MNMDRLSPVLLLLALAAPARAQDAGPGVMLQELAGLSDGAYAQDAGPRRAVLAQRQTCSPAGVRVFANLKGVSGRKAGTNTSHRSSPAVSGEAGTSELPTLDTRMEQRGR